ncbi:MAG: Tat pathway signal protein [Pseudomonadota bacterium]
MISRRAVLGTGLAVGAIGAAGYGLWPRLDAYEGEVAQQRVRPNVAPATRELIRLATLAANSHNTQPWQFEPTLRSVRILPDLTRRTKVVDPDDHHLWISLGCAAENLAIGAGARGQFADIEVEGGSTPSVIASFGPAQMLETELYQAIPFRQSTRSNYDGQPLSNDDLRTLELAISEPGVSVSLFTSEADLAAITEFVIEGNSAQIDDPAFVAELREWLRFSPNRAVETGDGLFSACTGNPVVPEWVGGALFSAFLTKEAENDRYSSQVASSAGIAVFTGDRADPEHWVKVGRSFQRFALQATVLGIRNAHVNQPIEVPSVRPAFASWLGAPEARPDLVVRFGRAPAMPMSLRRPVDAVIV